MNLVTAISNLVSELTDKVYGPVHVASYTSKDSVTYVLSDDQTYVHLIVRHAEKKLTEEARVNIIAPNLVRMLTEGTEVQRSESDTAQLTRELEEQG
jgi:hypothetical protein